MASIFRRLFINKTTLTKRCISTTRPNLQKEMPDPLEHSTGLQKKEMLAYIEGKCDPFNMAVVKRGSGSKDNPTLVNSAFNGRIVGCICNDNRFVNYMWLERGCPKRCECGHWFKLNEVAAFE